MARNRLRDQLNEATKKITELEKKIDDAKKKSKKFGDVTQKEIKETVKELGTLNKVLGKSVTSIKSMNKEVRDLHMEGALDTDEAKKLNDELKEITKQVLIVKKVNKQAKKDNSWGAQHVEIKKLNKMISKTRDKTNLARNSAKSFVDHMSEAGPSFMKGWASFNKASKKGQTAIQSYQGMFNKAGSSLGKMPGLMKAFGGAAKGAAATLGGITKLIAGWPGAIIMALKAVWDMGMAADQFVKDANKAFAAMRGPDIMTGNIRKQFKDFNDQIFNARENIRVGLDVTQVRELLEAINQAGANITNLNKGLLNYRDAIYIAGKASKTLGLALPQVGNMVGKLLTNFRMDMESIDKAFVQVAFDAQKSGLSTDRFWTTVENASASLAYCFSGRFIGFS
jgi:predicted  nucleic acid-binding Zn-ribbon protein